MRELAQVFGMDGSEHTPELLAGVLAQFDVAIVELRARPSLVQPHRHVLNAAGYAGTHARTRTRARHGRFSLAIETDFGPLGMP